MSTIWLTYNPDKWPRSSLEAMIRRHAADPDVIAEWWRCSAFRSARIGDSVLLFKQNTKSPRGIFARGVVVEGPAVRQDLSCVDGERPRVGVRFTELTDPVARFLLPLERIDHIVPDSFVKARQSGTVLPDDVATALSRL